MSLQLRRTVKGTLDEVILNIGSVEEFQEVQYETACGELVVLELGIDQSLIYADYEEYFILVNVHIGKEGSLFDEGTVTFEDLQRIADEIDFTVLKNVTIPDMRGDSALAQGYIDRNAMQSSDAAIAGQTADSEQASELDWAAMTEGMETDQLLAYQEVLQNVYDHQIFPEGREFGYDGYPMSQNSFALKDIDDDGDVELILIYTTTNTAGHAEIIYDYDAVTGNVREQFIEYPAVTHFDNGILKVDWSHNQGLAGRVWPYTLYRYVPENDSYEAFAMVDAWDKSVRDTDYNGNAFPDEADQDGDLLIYYIMKADENEQPEPVDGAEFEQWFASWRGEADAISMQYVALTEENIAAISISAEQ
mgnify:CR=1 FL=1